MPRNSKCRRVCYDHGNVSFSCKNAGETVKITVEEAETLRLCDLEGADQDEAALSMNISRGTLQRILYQARKKTAEALINGKNIVIDGGNYKLADECCGRKKLCTMCRFDKGENNE